MIPIDFYTPFAYANPEHLRDISYGIYFMLSMSIRKRNEVRK